MDEVHLNSKKKKIVLAIGIVVLLLIGMTIIKPINSAAVNSNSLKKEGKDLVYEILPKGTYTDEDLGDFRLMLNLALTQTYEDRYTPDMMINEALKSESGYGQFNSSWYDAIRKIDYETAILAESLSLNNQVPEEAKQLYINVVVCVNYFEKTVNSILNGINNQDPGAIKKAEDYFDRYFEYVRLAREENGGVFVSVPPENDVTDKQEEQKESGLVDYSLEKLVGVWQGIKTTQVSRDGTSSGFDISENQLLWVFNSDGILAGYEYGQHIREEEYTLRDRILTIGSNERLELEFINDTNFNVSNYDPQGNRYIIEFVNADDIYPYLKGHQNNLNLEDKGIEDQSVNRYEKTTSVQVQHYNAFEFMGKSINYVEGVTGKTREVLTIENQDALTDHDRYVDTIMIQDGPYEFHFFVGDRVMFINLHENAEILGVRIGATIEEVKAKLGEPQYEGVSWDWDDLHVLTYRINEYELGFYSEDQDSPTLSAYIR